MEGQAVPEPADVFPSSMELALFVAQKKRRHAEERRNMPLENGFILRPSAHRRLKTANAISDGLTTESNDSR